MLGMPAAAAGQRVLFQVRLERLVAGKSLSSAYPLIDNNEHEDRTTTTMVDGKGECIGHIGHDAPTEYTDLRRPARQGPSRNEAVIDIVMQDQLDGKGKSTDRAPLRR